MTDERTSATCETCSGPIYRQRTIGTPHKPTGPWLHLRDEDWSERFGKTPHNAAPTMEAKQ